MELGRRKRDKDGEELRVEGELDVRDQALAAFLVRALHEARERDAVLVVLRPPDDVEGARERASRLVALASRLEHPALAKVHAAGEAVGLSFQIVEDLRRARSLAHLVESSGPAHWQEVVALGRTLASALAALHAAGLVHAGLSLEAIVLERSFSPKLALDARLLAFAGDASSSGEPGRAPPWPYRAPEDSRGPSVRGNLYSLGAVLYALLTGRPPVDGPPAPSALGVEVPEVLERLVLDLMSAEPERRPASAAEVVARLELWERS